MKKFLKTRLNKKGFTLAELLVVVGIIAVLVAIALPVFSGTLSKAKTAVGEANKRAARAEASIQYMLKSDVSKLDTGDGVVFHFTVTPSGQLTLDAPVAYDGTNSSHTDLKKAGADGASIDPLDDNSWAGYVLIHGSDYSN